MKRKLAISVGQYSDKGRKHVNQDFHGVYVPKAPLLTSKGIAIALADGISSSEVSQIASESSVKCFLNDYYSTPDAWSVKKSGHTILSAINSWLYSQTQKSQYRYNADKGYVCTLSAMVIKSTTAYIFHSGDARIYRLGDNTMEQLTDDHRLWVSQDKSYLSRALGIKSLLEIDYKDIQIEKDDIFLFATDGVYEHVNSDFIFSTIKKYALDLDMAAKTIVNSAYQNHSKDNLTCQIVRVDELPIHDANEIQQQLTRLPLPPILEPRMLFDGYRVIDEIYVSSRSHVYLVIDEETDTQVIMKTPSIGEQHDPQYLERFLLEEWIARRINSPHVLKPCVQTRKRNYSYIATEYVNGKTLTQWMVDNPQPDLQTVYGVIEQISKGLLAFHRLEMLHQDLRPDNIMIDTSGVVKIIDFGSTKVAGISEIESPIKQNNLLGTALYTAPEYFLGESGSPSSDMFSLAVITYQMMTGKLPYGTKVAQSRIKSAQNKLTYRSIFNDDLEIPAWVDSTLKKALHPNPHKRYEELSEFLVDLKHPSKEFLHKSRPPLLERNPTVFWKALCLILSVIIIFLLEIISRLS